MFRDSFSRFLIFCKRPVAVAILLSSLICHAWPNIKANAVYAAEVQSKVINSDTTRNVSAGEYANIEIDSSYKPASGPYVNITSGTVNLTGGAGVQLISPLPLTMPGRPSNAPIIIGPTGTQNATLLLRQGELNGVIYLNNRNTVTASLIAGSENGENTGGTVTINGLVLSKVSNYTTLKTNGSDLIINGAVGNGTYRVGTVEAYLGDITVNKSASQNYKGNGGLDATRISVNAGMAINIATYLKTSQLFIRENGSLTTFGDTSGNENQYGRIDVATAVDGVNGVLEKNSKLISTNDNIFFNHGITSGSGEITAGSSLVAHQAMGPGVQLTAETMVGDLNQGENGDLTLTAGRALVGGNIAANKLISNEGDIIAGTDIPTPKSGSSTTAQTVSGSIIINPAHVNNYFSPRGTLTANSVSAEKGGVYAGEITVTGDLSAANLLAVKLDAHTPNGGSELPASAGNVTITDGSFKFSGSSFADLLETYKNSVQNQKQLLAPANDSLDKAFGAQIDGALKVTGNGDSSFKALKVLGASEITGGTLSGDTLATQNGKLTDVKNVTINDLLEVSDNLGISGSDAAKIKTLTVGGAAELKDNDAVTVTGDTQIGATLAASGSGDASFNTLDIGQSVAVTGGSLTAAQISTGSKTGADGNLTLTGAKFSLGVGSTDASIIRGSLVAANSISGEFGTLNVDKNADVTGGALSGDTLTAQNVTLKDVNQTNITGALTATNDFAVSGTGTTTVAAASISGAFSLNDGSYTGTSLKTGGDSIFTNVKASSVGTAEIGGNITATDSVSLNFDKLSVGGSVTQNGGALSAKEIETGATPGKNGDFTVTNGSFSFTGEGRSQIRGSLNSTANGSGVFGSLLISENFNIDGGYAEGKSLTAATGAFTNNASVHIDELILTGDAQTLDIEDGSVVTVRKITDVSGNDLIVGKGLIILGDPDNPDDWSVLADVDLEESKLDGDQNLVRIRTGDVSGQGRGAAADDIKAHQLAANSINITDANIQLTGIGAYASSITHDLVINQNGDSRFGDVAVGGKTQISGGSAQARQFKTEGDANFDGVGLSLLGQGTNASSVGGDLTIANNEAAVLGDMNVTGAVTASGGSITANVLTAGKNATFTGADLVLNGSGDNPGKIKGDFTLADNQTASLGVLVVGGAANISAGTVTAQSLDAASASFENVKTTTQKMTITGASDFVKGEITANSFTANEASFTEGVVGAFESLLLDGGGKKLNVGSASESTGGTTVKIGSLNLSGGNVNVTSARNEPALLAVENFVDSTGQSSAINGNIGVGINGRLLLGSRDWSFEPQIAADMTAVFALAKPVRLGSGYGVHVTGAGAAAPEANVIKFDAGSLFVIDGSNTRVYYVGSWVPTAQLNANNGATGALSADAATTASVNVGSKIYIRNPVANTVIVALGENVTTKYTDASAASRGVNDSPWTGVNLDYDNKNAVTIERLDNEYAGQFMVKPKEETPDTPPAPANPGTPDNPSQPGAPENPANPAAPDNPASPGNPSDTPENPSAPTAPDNPASPGEPSVTPANPEPAKPAPSNPVKHPSQTHPNADPGVHKVIEDGKNKDTIGADEKHLVKDHGAGFISHTITHDQPHVATRLVEGAARMALTGAVPQMTFAANDAAAEVMRERLGALSWRTEDGMPRGFALWAVPLYKISAGWNLEAGSLNYDFNGAIGGIAIGGDVTFEDISRFGVTFNIGGGYAKNGGELTKTINNMSFWGAGLYGGWRPGNFGVSADVAFTSSYNKLKQDISELPGWGDLKADATAIALSAGMDFEYRLKTSVMDVAPHAGFKYHFLRVNDYDITHLGATIINGAGFDQNVWTFPLGVRFNREFSFDNGWTISPALDFRVTPAAGDMDAKTGVRFTNTDMDIDLRTKVRDYVTFGGSAGVEARLGSFTLGVNYNLEAGAQTAVNSIFGVVRYEF